MLRAQQAPWIVAALALIAGSALAGDKPIVKETKTPTAVMDNAVLPAECRQFQHLAPTTSPLYPWMQRLSFAACRQAITLPTVTDAEQLAPMVASLEHAMAPSIAIYEDAVAHAPPNQIRILAAYGLGRTYVDMIVRARTAIHGADESMLVYGGISYGGTAYLNRSLALHYALEPLLKAEHDGALAAYREVARLADEDPAAARANAIMPIAIGRARLESMILR